MADPLNKQVSPQGQRPGWLVSGAQRAAHSQQKTVNNNRHSLEHTSIGIFGCTITRRCRSRLCEARKAPHAPHGASISRGPSRRVLWGGAAALMASLAVSLITLSLPLRSTAPLLPPPAQGPAAPLAGPPRPDSRSKNMRSAAPPTPTRGLLRVQAHAVTFVPRP